jgi:hypothetical protein
VYTLGEEKGKGKGQTDPSLKEDSFLLKRAAGRLKT